MCFPRFPTYIALTISFCICIGAAAGLVIWRHHWPVDPYLETAHLSKAVSYSTLVLAEDTCYEICPDAAFGELFAFDRWKATKEAGLREYRHILTVKLGDEYELALREGGIAEAFNGYSRKYHTATAWYRIPEDVAAEVLEYVKNNGIIRQPLLGPESWFLINE